MGGAAARSVTQWSRGEYPRANRHEDDVGKIASVLGYVADEAGNDSLTAQPLNVKAGAVRQEGVISYTGDADAYSFTSIGGLLEIVASPAKVGADLKIALSLEDASSHRRVRISSWELDCV